MDKVLVGDKKIKVIYKARLQLTTPLMIGSGNNDNSDSDVIIDSRGKPFIPATTFIGVIRNAFIKEKLEDLFGTAAYYDEENDEELGTQSQIIVDDLYIDYKEPIKNLCTSIRDGIAIDAKNQTVIEKHKYDYEIVEPGAVFCLHIEFAKYLEKEKIFLKTLQHLLQNQQLSFGAKTNNGFGKLKLTESKLYRYDLTNKDHVWHWIKRETPDSLNIIDKDEFKKIEQLKLNQKFFTIKFIANLQNNIIIRDYRHDNDDADSVHLKSNGKPVISGSSLKGAIRSRALRIVNTIGKEKSIIDKLFGYDPVETKNISEKKESDKKISGQTEEKLIKGRLQVNEVAIKDKKTYNEEVQQRIKIDRFTGGTIDGALFNSRPVFRKGEEKNNLIFEFKIKNPEPHEKGLLLLVLKDLWTGDLPIGGEKNVGRGRLEGVEAEILEGGDKIQLNGDFSSLSDADKQTLESYVEALNQ